MRLLTENLGHFFRTDNPSVRLMESGFCIPKTIGLPVPDWIEKELRSNFARASRAGRLAAITEPRAARVAYRAQKHTLRIELTNGAIITLPVKLIPSLKGVRPKDLRAVESLAAAVACTGKASIST